MANNQKVFQGDHLPLNVGTGKLSGDPIVFGKMPGICEINSDANGLATVDLSGPIYACSVGGVVTGGTNGAVNVGDEVYFQSGATPKLNANATGGILFGTIVGTSFPYSVATGTQAVASGGTATVHIRVKRY